jgi:hypothetical protein
MLLLLLLSLLLLFFFLDENLPLVPLGSSELQRYAWAYAISEKCAHIYKWEILWREYFLFCRGMCGYLRGMRNMQKQELLETYIVLLRLDICNRYKNFVIVIVIAIYTFLSEFLIIAL